MKTDKEQEELGITLISNNSLDFTDAKHEKSLEMYRDSDGDVDIMIEGRHSIEFIKNWL